jgi:hypothetical protein
MAWVSGKGARTLSGATSSSRRKCIVVRVYDGTDERLNNIQHKGLASVILPGMLRYDPRRTWKNRGCFVPTLNGPFVSKCS